MNKTTAGLLGAAAAVTTMTGAHAQPAPQLMLAEPASYRDLLEPIPNAVALLRADDAVRLSMKPAAKMELVQYRLHHHHHHHHHNGFLPGVIGGAIGSLLAAPAPPPGPCYWTYGQPYWDGYRWRRSRVQVCP